MNIFYFIFLSFFQLYGSTPLECTQYIARGFYTRESFPLFNYHSQKVIKLHKNTDSEINFFISPSSEKIIDEKYIGHYVEATIKLNSNCHFFCFAQVIEFNRMIDPFEVVPFHSTLIKKNKSSESECLEENILEK